MVTIEGPHNASTGAGWTSPGAGVTGGYNRNRSVTRLSWTCTALTPQQRDNAHIHRLLHWPGHIQRLRGNSHDFVLLQALPRLVFLGFTDCRMGHHTILARIPYKILEHSDRQGDTGGGSDCQYR